MNARNSIVADGKARLLRATVGDRMRRHQELMSQLEQTHRGEFLAAGFLRRLALRRKLRKEAAALVGREFNIPSDGAHFLVCPRASVAGRVNRPPVPAAGVQR